MKQSCRCAWCGHCRKWHRLTCMVNGCKCEGFM